jgi:hypothetical protein
VLDRLKTSAVHLASEECSNKCHEAPFSSMLGLNKTAARGVTSWLRQVSRSARQDLGLKDYQERKLRGAISHLMSVALAHILVVFMKACLPRSCEIVSRDALSQEPPGYSPWTTSCTSGMQITRKEHASS